MAARSNPSKKSSIVCTQFAGDGANRTTLVEITGGEPLLQPEAPALAEKLLAAGYTVMIETSGERPVGLLPREVIKIVDVKCPDSGEPDTFDMDESGRGR